MKIVTGYRGTPHITANAMQALNQGIFGPGNHILDIGERFSATIVNASTIAVHDGEGVIQGVHFRMNPGEVETVSITPGTAGYARHDLICARYTKDQATGVEDVSLIVLEGTPASGTEPEEPAISTGDILNGATVCDYPLYSVLLDEMTPILRRRAAQGFALSQSIKQALTPTNGTPGEGGCFCYKVLSEVVVRVCILELATQTYYSNIIHLPDGYKPEYKVTVMTSFGVIDVDSDGYVSVYTGEAFEMFDCEVRFNVFA